MVLLYFLVQRDIDVASCCTPKRMVKVRDTDTWWTESLTIKRKILRNIYSKRLNHPRIMEKYKDLKKELRKEISKCRNKSWQDFCTQADSAKNVSRIIQIMENPPPRMMSLLETNGTVLNPRKSLEKLLNTHFPEGKIMTDPTQIHRCAQGDADEERDFTGVCRYITATKVRAALCSFGDYKASGPDEIPPIALRYLGENFLQAITMLYQLSVATGKIPAAWRNMNVVFIPKAGKMDYAVAKAYRPITLSNFLLKGLERIIQWFIMEYVIPEPLFGQHAYTKGRSCETALSMFIDDVEKAIFSKDFLLAVSLDCSGAFDCINFGSAKESMKRKSVPDNIIRWYCNLLRVREVAANVQGQNATVLPARGSPQGGVLSPTIWNLIVDTILTEFRQGPVKILGYADDILIYTSGQDAHLLGEILQPALNKIVKWGRENGLSFNPTKTHAVLFRHNKRDIKYPKMEMSGSALELVDSFKYLGVEIQKNLSWLPHIQERTNKCKYLLAKCRNVIGKSWGLTPDKMEWVHTAIVRPKLTYGSVVWAANMTKNMSLKITQVQRLALLAIIHPLRSAPTAGLEAMLGWMPLKLHVEKTAIMTFIRNKGVIKEQWDGIGSQYKTRGHLALWKRKEFDLLDGRIPQESRLQCKVWKEQSVREAKDHLPITIFTDASRTTQMWEWPLLPVMATIF